MRDIKYLREQIGYGSVLHYKNLVDVCVQKLYDNQDIRFSKSITQSFTFCVQG